MQLNPSNYNIKILAVMFFNFSFRIESIDDEIYSKSK